MIVKDGSIRYFRHYSHQVVDQQGRRMVSVAAAGFFRQLLIESRARTFPSCEQSAGMYYDLSDGSLNM